MNARQQYSLTGSAPERYERNMVPAIFEPCAKGLLEFTNLHEGEHVLDHCGTTWGHTPEKFSGIWSAPGSPFRSLQGALDAIT